MFLTLVQLECFLCLAFYFTWYRTLFSATYWFDVVIHLFYHVLCLLMVVYWFVSFEVTSLTLGQSCDCPSAYEATLNDMGKCIPWIKYEITQTKENKTVCMFHGIYCTWVAVCDDGKGKQNRVHISWDILHLNDSVRWWQRKTKTCAYFMGYTVLEWQCVMMTKEKRVHISWDRMYLSGSVRWWQRKKTCAYWYTVLGWQCAMMAKENKTVCIFHEIYCTWMTVCDDDKGKQKRVHISWDIMYLSGSVRWVVSVQLKLTLEVLRHHARYRRPFWNNFV